jgi:hypothetical protein
LLQLDLSRIGLDTPLKAPHCASTSKALGTREPSRDHIRVGQGANNLFNVYPDRIPASVYQNLNYDQYSHLSPFGVDGAFYYGRVTVNF